MRRLKYITGVHALNLPCLLPTCGDWHQSALQWEKPFVRDSEESVFGDYGIETGKQIPEHKERFNAANHIRALLDLLELGNYHAAQGMRDDYICNDAYTEEIFKMVWKLKGASNWDEVDRFMGKEYFRRWLEFKKENK